MPHNSPPEWLETTIGQVCRVRRGASPRPIDSPAWFADEGPGWVRIIDVTRSDGRLRSTEQRLSARGAIRSVPVYPGQLVMSICATVGVPVVLEIEACIHDGFVVFDRYENEADTQFLYHFLKFMTQYFRSMGQTGTQANLNTGIVNATRILLPPLYEQRRIAEILDSIDEAIQKTEALIEKLKAMKQGLLHDLLTRGLDENGKLRDPKAHPEQFEDSPLGRIPGTWDIMKCDDVCSEIVVGIVIRPAQYYRPSGVPVLRSANIREDGLVPSDLVYMSAEANKLLFKSQVHEGNVLTVRTGYPGTSCVVPPEFDGANCVDLLISRPKEGIASGYLNLWINSDLGKMQVLRKQGGLAQQHFNVGELKNLLIAKPSLAEQQEIVAIFEEHSVSIKAEEQYLAKLKLQKKGLMHDLLTGRVRVRVQEEETRC